MSEPIAVLRQLSKQYQMGPVTVNALHGVDLAFPRGEYVAIMGPSGSGKSTLLNLMACLDRPTGGQYVLVGQDVSDLDDDALSSIRCRHLGFIFQSYNLIAQLTVLENIEVPLFYQGLHPSQCAQRCRELAEMVGLGKRLNHRPAELSGGEQQRVAIARALANDPYLILADEPTGNLDSATGAEILAIMDDLHRQQKTLIVVTHDPGVGERAQRTVCLQDGQVVSDT